MNRATMKRTIYRLIEISRRGKPLLRRDNNATPPTITSEPGPQQRIDATSRYQFLSFHSVNRRNRVRDNTLVDRGAQRKREREKAFPAVLSRARWTIPRQPLPLLNSSGYTALTDDVYNDAKKSLVDRSVQARATAFTSRCDPINARRVPSRQK